jgi:hypothetical protein
MLARHDRYSGEGRITMDGRAFKGTRAALLAAAVMVAALVALPATAYAHSATRIVVAASKTVDRSTPGIDPWTTATLTARLQKRITSTHYHALSGTVKLYVWDMHDEVYAYTGLSRKGSSVSFPLSGRGKYKLVYGGSSTTKASSRVSTVYENVGLTLSAPTVSITPVAGSLTQSWVTLAYTVGWNTEAWGGRVVVDTEAWFQNDVDYEGIWIRYENEPWAPGTVEFNVKVANTDIMLNLRSYAYAYVDEWYDPYVIASAYVDDTYPVP